jgi:hypothetical protein
MYNGALADMGLGLDPYTGNRYAFTGGNPTSLIELDGHCPRDMCDWLDTSKASSDAASSTESTAVVRNGGSTNVYDLCDSGTGAMHPHDASVCETGFAVENWAKAEGITGYTIIDLPGPGMGLHNPAALVPGASGKSDGGDGYARRDVLQRRHGVHLGDQAQQ